MPSARTEVKVVYVNGDVDVFQAPAAEAVRRVLREAGLANAGCVEFTDEAGTTVFIMQRNINRITVRDITEGTEDNGE